MGGLDGSLVTGSSVQTAAQGSSSAFNGGTSIPAVQIPTMASLASLTGVVAGQEGTLFYVQSARDYFALEANTSGAAARAGVRIAVSGLSGYQFVRRPFRNPYWEVQAAWEIDPTNSTGLASDDGDGSSSHPLLTWNELALRLAHAEINQTTVVTVLGDQQAGDNPTFTYNCRGLLLMQFTGSPSVLYSSTVTGYTAANYTAAAADDNELVDSAVPGGSFTAAGALAKGVLIKRTNGTVIYCPVLKDLGSTTARVGQPINLASVIANVSFSVSDSYQLIKLPKITSFVLVSSSNQGTQIGFFDWQVPPASTNGMASIDFNCCYFEKVFRPIGGAAVVLNGGCIDAGGGSFEGGGGEPISMFQVSLKGTGAALYSFSGPVNTEGCVLEMQGAGVLIENGIWNAALVRMHDSSIAAVRTGTGAKAQLLGAVSGKNNTGVLFKATNSSQIVSTNAISTGNAYVSASTSAGSPVQWGSTTSTTGTPGTPPLDANMNGVFQTA